MSETAIELTSTAAIPPGTRLGKYEVLKRLRSGGMAEIYVARSHGAAEVKQLAVIKRILPHLAEDPEFVRMFLNEAKITASLDHPNIAHVKEVGNTKGSFFLALEFVHGVDLRQILRRISKTDPVPMGAAIGIVSTCAEALGYAHERSIVHRDMSPSNVMVTYYGHVKVLDFGIAKATRTAMTRTGTIKGKVGYMSPEQCMAEDIDRRSDVFSLGVLLYELTLRKRLFRGDSDFAIMNQITLGRIARPTDVEAGYPPELEAIILKAVAVDREDRYQTAADLGQALSDFAFSRELRTSTAEISAWMQGLYPNPPPPVSPAELSEVPAVATQLIIPTRWTMPGAKKGRRGATIGIASTAVGVALGAAVMAFVQRGEAAAENVPPPPEAVLAPLADDALRTGTGDAAEPELSGQVPPVLDIPTDPGPAEASDPSPPAVSTPSPSPKRKKRRKKRRKKAKPNREPTSSLFPPSRGGGR